MFFYTRKILTIVFVVYAYASVAFLVHTSCILAVAVAGTSALSLLGFLSLVGSAAETAVVMVIATVCSIGTGELCLRVWLEWESFAETVRDIATARPKMRYLR